MRELDMFRNKAIYILAPSNRRAGVLIAVYCWSPWPWVSYTLINNLFFPTEVMITSTRSRKHAYSYHWPNGFSNSLCGSCSLHGLLSFFSFPQTSGPASTMSGSVLPVELCSGRQIIEWKSDGGANLAGVICYVFGLLIWVTTLPPVRKRYFELFFYTHQLYVLFVIFLALHIGDTNFSKVFGGIFLFMLDRFLRFCQSRMTVNIVSMKSLPCGTVKLVLSKPGNLGYNALSFIFLRVREISWLQWHPFSVSSSPLDGKYHLSVLVKAFGDWTSMLSRKVSNITEDSQIELPLLTPGQIMASVEGPYGHESPYHLMYEKLVLVAGGSGISPFLAISSDILHRTKDKKTCVPRNVLLVWAVKRSNELSLFSSTGVESICSFFSDKLNIEVQMYVTRESEPSLEEGNIHKATSSPVFSIGGGISALVGTGNKIWVGCYVIISTIGFVISLTCMVVSVFIYGGFVVGLWHLWEKRTLAMEESQEDGVKTDMMQRNEVFTEKNLYQETLASSYAVRYGCRPDFKGMFPIFYGRR
ncbi:hypothetical protein CIPAW_05G000100 [Carya illinoinensis]|uniref:FAD-binding FR-type domain-containing protein n=1 Tax=Carya illinoinensis TaxID=32201 RepID=A0A8T1QDN6_CARIL|nr:hypothetical protein CIPAW_05G000100 [Carya illinoinensis]